MVWLVLLALACASFVCARDAPLVAIMSPRAHSNVLRAPDTEKLASRSSQVSADYAASRLVHHCDSAGVPEVCSLDALVHLEVDAVRAYG